MSSTVVPIVPIMMTLMITMPRALVRLLKLLTPPRLFVVTLWTAFSVGVVTLNERLRFVLLYVLVRSVKTPAAVTL